MPRYDRVNSRKQYVLRFSVPRFIVSVLLGAVFYLAWMVMFLVCSAQRSPVFRGFLWILAPIITSLGFWAGLVIFNRIGRIPQPRLGRLYLYPLVGCSIGAAVVFWFGPMLIVFGMCLLGSLAMVLFELVDFHRFAGTTQINHH